jgi:hypothetical protein
MTTYNIINSLVLPVSILTGMNICHVYETKKPVVSYGLALFFGPAYSGYQLYKHRNDIKKFFKE